VFHNSLRIGDTAEQIIEIVQAAILEFESWSDHQVAQCARQPRPRSVLPLTRQPSTDLDRDTAPYMSVITW